MEKILAGLFANHQLSCDNYSMKFLIICFIIAAPAFAQHSEQPLAESNSDLRGQQVLFSAMDEDDEFKLERSSNFEYFLSSGEKGKEVRRKIDRKEAETLDKEFAGLFIKSMYEFPAYEGKCSDAWNLKMKGDVHKICEEDEQRYQLFRNFVKPLRKKHSL